ncbi:hypothetical protein Y1Q_0003169 [Alligator mississippiensis]|uniref:Uncharacterized protein n=1 Tax=Alligator mississippiensis TaxID=8496 RepID=A0A151MDS8_ALLMI|nr:hypothetical protein Y1Q_0003169 [Alligator mississippiensis]
MPLALTAGVSDHPQTLLAALMAADLHEGPNTAIKILQCSPEESPQKDCILLKGVRKRLKGKKAKRYKHIMKVLWTCNKKAQHPWQYHPGRCCGQTKKMLEEDAGRPKTSWTTNTNDWMGLKMTDSTRIAKDRDEWMKVATSKMPQWLV